MVVVSSPEIWSLFSRLLVLSQRFDYAVIRKHDTLFRLYADHTAAEIVSPALPGEVVLTCTFGKLNFLAIDDQVKKELTQQVRTFNAVIQPN